MAVGFAQGPAVAQRLGEAAVDAAKAGLVARLVEAAPEIAVTTEAAAVVLTAPGLVPRVFGSRRRGADPRLAGLLGGAT
jgi:hypothetical protein